MGSGYVPDSGRRLNSEDLPGAWVSRGEVSFPVRPRGADLLMYSSTR